MHKFQIMREFQFEIDLEIEVEIEFEIFMNTIPLMLSLLNGSSTDLWST